MKGFVLLALSIVGIPAAVFAQAPADPYADILAGAPVAQRDGAWVMDAGTSSAHIMLPPQE